MFKKNPSLSMDTHLVYKVRKVYKVIKEILKEISLHAVGGIGMTFVCHAEFISASSNYCWPYTKRTKILKQVPRVVGTSRMTLIRTRHLALFVLLHFL